MVAAHLKLLNRGVQTVFADLLEQDILLIIWLGKGHKILSERRKPDAAGRAVKNRLMKFILNVLYEHTEIRLLHVQLLCSLSDRTAFHDFDQLLDLFNTHREAPPGTEILLCPLWHKIRAASKGFRAEGRRSA